MIIYRLHFCLLYINIYFFSFVLYYIISFFNKYICTFYFIFLFRLVLVLVFDLIRLVGEVSRTVMTYFDVASTTNEGN